MLLKLKNKTLLTMDKLLKDALDKNGVPENFVFEPKEAADFFRELRDNKLVYQKAVEIQQIGDGNIDIRLLLRSELTQDNMYMLINKWYRGELIVKYCDTEIHVYNKKVIKSADIPTSKGPMDEEHVLQPVKTEIPILPAPAKTPISRIIINEHTLGRCEECGSSVHRKWGLFSIDGCINPDCENYHKKN